MQRKQFFVLALAVLFVLLIVPTTVSFAVTDVFSTPGTFTYTVPTGVTQLTVELWGAGGGGGGGSEGFFCISSGGGGGGAGGYVKGVLSVLPGQTFTLTVGANAPNAPVGGNGIPGGTTEFFSGMSPHLTAIGGAGGKGGSCSLPGGGGAGGNGTGIPNDIVILTQTGTGGIAGTGTSGGMGGAGFQGVGAGGRGGNPDNQGNSGHPGQVVITTANTNTAPTAVNDAYSINAGGVLFIAAPGVLTNDTDPENNPLTAQVVANPANGILALNSNGSFFYTPNANFVGIDSFTYQVSDSISTSQASVSITVTPTGTSAPSVKAVQVPGTTRISDPVQIDIVLENPFLAPGGGIDALEARCDFTPGNILQGTTVTPSPAIFTPDPAIINKSFQGSHVLYAVSQSGNNPPVSATGTVFSLTLTALAAGQSTLNCAIKAIDGTGAEMTLPFVGVVVTVQNLAPGTGIVQGTVHYSHKTGGGVTVKLLTGTTVVATTTTQANGAFTLSHIPVGTYTIRAESPGYLSAQGSVTVIDQQTVTKSTVTLLAGDLVTTPPAVIDELDVVQLAISYGQSVPPASPAADLNGDSVVGLADLNALAANLRQTGPINWN